MCLRPRLGWRSLSHNWRLPIYREARRRGVDLPDAAFNHFASSADSKKTDGQSMPSSDRGRRWDQQTVSTKTGPGEPLYGEEAEAVDAGPFCSIGLGREMIRDMMVRCVEQLFDTITPGSARTRDAG